jgi:hypothetical protein
MTETDPAGMTAEDGQLRPFSVPARSVRRCRLVGLVMAAPCLGILGVAAWLTPSPTGLETHRALGLPGCGFFQATGVPCPSCGMTTAFAHAAHGHLWQAWVAQPAGCVLAVLTAMLAITGLWSLASGMDGAGLAGRLIGRKPVLGALALLLLAAWGWNAWRHGHRA